MYKKITLITTILLFSLTLNAEYTNLERTKDMKIMEEAMSKIQKGLLTNNKKILAEGVDTLQMITRKVEPPVDVNSVLAQENTYKYKFSRKQGEKIIRFAGNIKKEMEAGNKHSASKDFVHVLDECISCHNKIRKWQTK
jgi:ribosomal protein S28E/S33